VLRAKTPLVRAKPHHNRAGAFPSKVHQAIYRIYNQHCFYLVKIRHQFAISKTFIGERFDPAITDGVFRLRVADELNRCHINILSSNHFATPSLSQSPQI